MNNSIGWTSLMSSANQPSVTGVTTSVFGTGQLFSVPDPSLLIGYPGATRPEVPDGSIIIQSKPEGRVFVNGIDVMELVERVDTLTTALNETRERLEGLMDMHLLLLRDVKAKSGEPVPRSVLGTPVN